jgi:hypothetical protein
MHLCRNRIDLINKIEMNAIEESQLWDNKVKINVSNKRNSKPLHERLIEAKLTGSRSSYTEKSNKSGSTCKKYKNT